MRVKGSNAVKGTYNVKFDVYRYISNDSTRLKTHQSADGFTQKKRAGHKLVNGKILVT